jgi:hypothetical protein
MEIDHDVDNVNSNKAEKIKIFSKKRKDANITSRIGDLLTQKMTIPSKKKQVIRFEKDEAIAGLNDHVKDNMALTEPQPQNDFDKYSQSKDIFQI